MGFRGFFSLLSADQEPPSFSPWSSSLAFRRSLWFVACSFSRCASSCAMKASLVHRFSSFSKFGFDRMIFLSLSRAHVREVILYLEVFVWSFAKFFMSLLKVSQSVWGLAVSLLVFSVCSLLISVWRIMPLFTTVSRSLFFTRLASGHVHRPRPTTGASAGAYLSCTSQWSVGTEAGAIFQAKVRLAIDLAT